MHLFPSSVCEGTRERDNRIAAVRNIAFNVRAVILEFYNMCQYTDPGECVASVTNCGLGLETAMAPTVNRGWQLFTNGKYWKSFSQLFRNYTETKTSISAERFYFYKGFNTIFIRI